MVHEEFIIAMDGYIIYIYYGCDVDCLLGVI